MSIEIQVTNPSLTVDIEQPPQYDIAVSVLGMQGPPGSGGGGGGATNLSYDTATRTVASDTGTDAVLTLADGTNAGLMASADFTKLAGISGTNTGDQTVTLTGEATGSGTGSFAVTLANSAVIAKVLTGFAVGSRVAVVAADSILAAFGKVQKYLNDLSALAFSGSAADLTGTKTAAFISDFDTAVAANSAVAANTAKVTNATHTGDVTGATALTIAADAVTNAKAANMATATIKGRSTAGTGDPEDLTGTQATALLDAFTDVAKGLVPASGGGTVNFLRADGTFAAPGGGGSPGGTTGEVQFNSAGAFAGAADVEIENGHLRLLASAAPATPATGGVKLVGAPVPGNTVPAWLSQDGVIRRLQSDLSQDASLLWRGAHGLTTLFSLGGTLPTATGTATLKAYAATNAYTRQPLTENLVTVAATTAVAGYHRNSANFYVCSIGSASAGVGGFYSSQVWGPATGVATATHRAFCGLATATTAPSDVEPSTLVNVVGMGWDAADANVQMMHNDASGACTKVDLGASFPVPTTDRTALYRLEMFSPPGTTQTVDYRVTNLATGDVATGQISTNMPSTATLLMPRAYCSVGGTSSVVGIGYGNTAVCQLN